MRVMANPPPIHTGKTRVCTSKFQRIWYFHCAAGRGGEGPVPGEELEDEGVLRLIFFLRQNLRSPS